MPNDIEAVKARMREGMAGVTPGPWHTERIHTLEKQLVAAEARAEKAAEDMRERAAKVAEITAIRTHEPGIHADNIAVAIRALASLPKESADAD